jgi:hypothetical protein
MKRIVPLLFMGFLVFLFFSKDIVSGDKVFAPLDLIYSYHPWGDYKLIPFQNFQQVDALVLYIPWRLYGYEQMHEGRFPLYNPYEYGGAPFFANDQSGVLSPYNLIGLFFDFQTGFLIIALLKLLVAAAGMYLFLDLFSLNKPSLIIGSTAYTFSALMITWLYHPVSGVVSFIPWFFWAGERLLRSTINAEKRHIFGAVLMLALITALSFFAGHSETTANVLIGLVIYSGTSILIRSKDRIKLMLYFSSALILGVMLASVHIIPFLQLLVNSEPFQFRSQVFNDSSLAQSSHLPLNALLTWLVPNLWGNPSYDYFTLNKLIYIFERYSYIGIAPLLLGLYTLRSIKADYKRLLPFWVLILAGFGMAYEIPVFSRLTALPLMKAGSSARYVFLMEFGFCALSAFGLNTLINNGYSMVTAHNKNKKAFIVAGIVSLLSVLLYLVARENIGLMATLFSTVSFDGRLSWITPERFSFIILQIIIALLFLSGSIWFMRNAYKRTIDKKIAYSGIILLTVVDLFIFGIGYNPDVSRKDFYPKTSLIDELQSLDTKDYTFYAPGNTMPADIAMIYHLRDFRGYDMIVSQRYQDFLYLLFPEERPVLGVGGWSWWKSLPQPAIASIAGIKYFILPTGFDPNRQGNYFTIIGTYGNLSLWNNEFAKPIVYAASRVIPSDSDPNTMSLLSNASMSDIGSAIVQGAHGYHDYDPDQIELKTMEDKPGKYKLMVHARSDGFLVFNLPVYPGWHAYVDDKPVHIYPTNYLFQGIKLMTGRYIVRFEYMPEAFVIGASLSIITGIFMLVSSIVIIFIRFHFLKSRSASE